MFSVQKISYRYKKNLLSLFLLYSIKNTVRNFYKSTSFLFGNILFVSKNHKQKQCDFTLLPIAILLMLWFTSSTLPNTILLSSMSDLLRMLPSSSTSYTFKLPICSLPARRTSCTAVFWNTCSIP